MFRNGISYANVTATLALLLAAGGVAVASIPGPDGRFHGCYADAGGALRIVDSDAACQARETRITFSQTGPQGPAGPRGAEGADGLGRPVVGPIIGAVIASIAAVIVIIGQTQAKNKEDKAELKEQMVKLRRQQRKLRRLQRCKRCLQPATANGR